MSGPRKNVDVRRLGAAASFPGIDPRSWIVWVTVLELGFDAEEGLFADVQVQNESGDEFTVYIGTPYAGNGFGIHFPIEVEDTVLLAIPGGDPDNGATIIARGWNAADKPAAAFGDGEVPSTDVVLITKAEANLRLQTPDAQIVMQDGSQSYVRGEDLESALETFGDDLITAAGKLVPGPGTVPLTSVHGASFLADVNIAVAKLKAAVFLSTKIKGE